jgi:ADP-ribosylation factor related protein 1
VQEDSKSAKSMFSLIQGFYSYFTHKPSVNILIIGLDNAGKTTLLEYVKGRFGKQKSMPNDSITPTIGMNIAKFNYDGVQIMLWDLGGQEKMRSIWKEYYTESDGVVFVLDSTDTSRLQEARDAFEKACADELLMDVPAMIFANKQDLRGALDVKGLSSVFNTSSYSKILSVSAITGRGVDEALISLISEAKWHALH